MKLKLGILGADDTLEIIMSVARGYKELDTLPLFYWEEEEIVGKLQPQVDKADMWLFSGQVPYAIAKAWGGINKPMFYVTYDGSSLYRTLLKIALERQWELERLSYDTFRPIVLERTFAEVNIHGKPNYVKYYPGMISATELSNYHEALYQSGKTEGAVTCLRSAFLELQRRGVPVFRVLPTMASVESVLNLILRTQEALHFRDTQIAVQMIEVDSFLGLVKNKFVTDELYKLEIKVTEKLLRYAKKVNGSLKQAGPGRYVIFTTRRLLQDITGDFTFVPDLEDLQITKDAITCGIGIGKTAYEAETHAGQALLHAHEHGKGSWMAFFDDNTIVGPLGRPEQIAYSCSPEAFQVVSQSTSLSTSTLSKLASVLKKRDSQEVDAHELAQHLNILPRSARRLLSQLENAGYAEVVGEANPHPRGRSRKVYRVNL